jgi:hypothetical protein
MKKKILIIVIAVIIIALAVYFYLQTKKKAAASNSLMTTVKSSVNPGTNIVPANQQSISVLGNTSQAYPYVNVLRDGTKGQAIIQFQPVSYEPKIGESVKIPSGIYAGTHKIWYIYSGMQNGQQVRNLYLDTAFAGADSGLFYKA